MELPRGALLLLALLAAPMAAHAASDWQWHTGRATHYGGAGDPWSIHDGHCGYGFLSPNVATGRDICAPSDQNWDYDEATSSCGVCYEIACQPMDFSDFYGNWLQRSDVCFDTTSSVVVMVTDLCPCYYPTNAYSNKRWCCGDMQHFDVSVFAFEKLADVKFGVIGIKYRRVPCDYSPDKKAVRPNSVSAAWDTRQPPAGYDDSKDGRWALWSKTQSWNSADGGSSRASASASASASGSGSGSASASALASSISVTYNGGSSSSGSSSSSGGGSQSTVTNAYYGGFMQGWSDSGSWALTKWDRDSSWGFNGQQAYCVTLDGYGGAKFNAWSGVLSSKAHMEFWVKQNDGQTPDISLKLASPSGSCRTLNLRSFTPAETSAGWSRFWINLNAFDWRRSDGGDGSAFGGCSDAISDWDVNTLFFANNWGGQQWLCIDQLKLF